MPPPSSSSSSSSTTISSLPEELLLSILSHLDTSPPPSERNARKEPSLALSDTASTQAATLKNISLVSQNWRRVVLPLLFKHSRLRLGEEKTSSSSSSSSPSCTQQAAQWRETCSICSGLFASSTSSGTSSSSTSTSTSSAVQKSTQQAPAAYSYHQQLVADATRMSRAPYAEDATLGRPNWKATLQIACEWYHCVQDYLSFLATHRLESYVQSFVLVNAGESSEDDRKKREREQRFPHRLAANQDYRYRAAAALWQHVLQRINPTRVVVVASPADLACLVNCAVDMFGDWAFSDMAYHILDLRIDATTNTALEQAPIDFDTLEYVPTQYPGIAESSLLGLKLWTEIGLNEGSFLSAYGTYHFFEHGAPSLVASIKDCLSPPDHVGEEGQHTMRLPAVRKLVYTAILPFANHVDFHSLLPCLDELDCKLAPDPESGILSDKSRVGRAQLGDCWQEFFTSYQIISRPFRTHNILADGQPRLTRFVCRDFQNPLLVEELDETFLWLCMPCWAEMKPGVFDRQAEIPDYEHAPIGF